MNQVHFLHVVQFDESRRTPETTAKRPLKGPPSTLGTAPEAARLTYFGNLKQKIRVRGGETREKVSPETLSKREKRGDKYILNVQRMMTLRYEFS